ncbi:hypothetical protein [Flavobacterium sp. NRK F7]|uniref:hypothetical protein n=1 Tax=Flavobacterium sp. NRK F7 TaxID=2954930 RepID=UPI00209176B5|nr:hypothetical protein [Flavobacterium sp. NRK F7]MCO6162140.1 hypothetical protein [Flavobacterium sp. NRK F7]
MKMTFKILFFLLVPILNFSQNTYYLEGKLGKSVIFMEISEYDNNYLEGNYFYEKSLKDIRLNGKFKEQSYNLYFGNDYEETDFEEKFELTKVNSDFIGQWKNKAGKNITVTLKKIEFSKYPKFEFDEETDRNLDAVKTNYIHFSQDSIASYKNQEIIWFTEKHCATPFFRLGNTFPEETRNMINSILEKKHIEMTLNQLSCSSPFSYNTGGGIEYNITITYLDNNLLGYHIFLSYYCGGAHPDFGGEGNVIDLHSGKKYEIDDILAFDKSVTSYNHENFMQFSDYRTNYFGPKVFELINQNEKFETPTYQEDYCDYKDLSIWTFPQWNFTEQGIEFTPTFARVIRSCETSFLIPFTKLHEYKNVEFPYDFKTN